MSEPEIAEHETNGYRVLRRRHLEAYLFDDDVLRRLCHASGQPKKLIRFLLQNKRLSKLRLPVDMRGTIQKSFWSNLRGMRQNFYEELRLTVCRSVVSLIMCTGGEYRGIALLLAFGVGFLVRPFVDRDRRHDWSSELEERYAGFTPDHNYG